MLIYNKLKLIRKLLSLSQAEIERETGLSQRDISQLENGKKKFIPTAYIQYLNKRGIPLELLFDDDLSLSSFEVKFNQSLISDKDKNCKVNCKDDCKVNVDLPSESRKTKSTSFEKEENKAPIFLPNSGKTTSTNIVELPVPIEDESELIAIPVVDISVAAGSGFYNPDYLSEIDCIRFPKSMIKGHQNYLCVRIKGESMAPTLLDGGYLVIRMLDRCEWEDIRDGHVYVVSDADGRAFVKRLKNRLHEYGFIVCCSDNPDTVNYPNFNLKEDELNTIWHAEWYISAKMPNIHATYYNKVSEMENAIDDIRRTFTEELRQVRRDIKALSRPS